LSETWFTPRKDGAAVAVRLTPRAKADRLLGIAAGPQGPVLRVAVAAPPESGRANEALLRLLANLLDAPRRDLAIVSGAASRDKLVHIAGPTARINARLAAALATLPDA
jgi:uncharacterized protein (TIGR00251 family)